jgi:hypothetical protein
MLIAVDFDGVIVSKDRPFADVLSPFKLLPYAKEGLASLKAAGHTLLLFSARANRALLFTPEWDPLVRAGVKRPNQMALGESRGLYWARYLQMVKFVETELAGLIDAIDDGMQGKPLADLFVDDRASEFGVGANGWLDLAHLYGAPLGQE